MDGISKLIEHRCCLVSYVRCLFISSESWVVYSNRVYDLHHISSYLIMYNDVK